MLAKASLQGAGKVKMAHTPISNQFLGNFVLFALFPEMRKAVNVAMLFISLSSIFSSFNIYYWILTIGNATDAQIFVNHCFAKM